MKIFGVVAFMLCANLGFSNTNFQQMVARIKEVPLKYTVNSLEIVDNEAEQLLYAYPSLVDDQKLRKDYLRMAEYLTRSYNFLKRKMENRFLQKGISESKAQAKELAQLYFEKRGHQVLQARVADIVEEYQFLRDPEKVGVRYEGILKKMRTWDLKVSDEDLFDSQQAKLQEDISFLMQVKKLPDAKPSHVNSVDLAEAIQFATEVYELGEKLSTIDSKSNQIVREYVVTSSATAQRPYIFVVEYEEESGQAKNMTKKREALGLEEFVKSSQIFESVRFFVKP